MSLIVNSVIIFNIYYVSIITICIICYGKYCINKFIDLQIFFFYDMLRMMFSFSFFIFEKKAVNIMSDVNILKR